MCSRTDFWFHFSHYVCGEKKKMNSHCFLIYKTVSNVSMCTYFSINNQGCNNIQCLQWWWWCFLASLAAHDNYILSLIQRYPRNCVCVRCCSASSYRMYCALSTLPPSPLSHGCDHSTSYKSKATPCACGKKTKEFGIIG